MDAALSGGEMEGAFDTCMASFWSNRNLELGNFFSGIDICLLQHRDKLLQVLHIRIYVVSHCLELLFALKGGRVSCTFV